MKWARIKLRTLILFVVVVALGLGWLARQRRAADAQGRTVDVLYSGGAFPWYDYEWVGGKPSGLKSPKWPRWLVRPLGHDFFSHVVRVDFDPEGTDREMAHVAALSQLEELSLAWSAVTNEGLIHLAGLPKLRLVDLQDTSVDDRGLVHLEKLSGLRSLNLDKTAVSNAGLVHLRGLSRLEELYLADTEVADEGLVQLEKLSRMRILHLRSTRVTNRGMVHLRGMKNLELLDVQFTVVTDFGVLELRESLPGVKVLYNTSMYTR